MNSKKNIFKQKISPEYISLIEQAQELKLYLIQENGPSSFQFKNDQDEKFKVSIGVNELNCSCNKKNEHCIHTIYVILKIFRKEIDDPIICKPIYSDQEISDLIASRYQLKTITTSKKNYLLKNSKIQKKLSKTQLNNLKSKRKQINEESICPICQEILDDQKDAIYYCKKQCGNNFHLKCVKIWVSHKESIKNIVTCPMCRSDWGSNILNELLKEEDLFINRYTVHKGTTCEGCSLKPIKGNIYHCIYCPNYFLCENCFNNWVHSQHNKFITKNRNDSDWIVAKDRTNINFTNKIDNLNKFLIDCIPNVNDVNFNNQLNRNPLQIIGCDILKNKPICIICQENHIELKKLNCGHIIDKKCINELMIKSVYYCPIDQIPFLDGWPAIHNTKIEIKKIETEKKNNFFDKNFDFEKNSIKKNMNFRIKNHKPIYKNNQIENIVLQGIKFTSIKNS